MDFLKTMGAVFGIGFLCLVVHYYAWHDGYRCGWNERGAKL